MTRIVIEPLDISGDRGQVYRVHCAGEVLIERTWSPELDAARALVAMGITGRVEVWRAGKAHADSTFVAAKAAKLTIVENSRQGPTLAPWEPFPSTRVTPPVAVLELAST